MSFDRSKGFPFSEKTPDLFHKVEQLFLYDSKGWHPKKNFDGTIYGYSHPDAEVDLEFGWTGTFLTYKLYVHSLFRTGNPYRVPLTLKQKFFLRDAVMIATS